MLRSTDQHTITAFAAKLPNTGPCSRILLLDFICQTAAAFAVLYTCNNRIATRKKNGGR